MSSIRLLLYPLSVLALVCASASAELAYVANVIDETVSVVDLETNEEIATIGNVPRAFDLALVDTTLIAHGDGGITGAEGIITFIDTESRLITGSLNTGVENVAGIRLSPDRSRAYLYAAGGEILVLDVASRSLLPTTTTLSFLLSGLAVHPAGDRLYVANRVEHTITVLDASNLAVIDTVLVPFDGEPSALFINPAGTSLWAGTRDNVLYAIDTATLDITEVSAGFNLQVADVMLSSDEGTAYLVGRNPVGVGEFLSIDTDTGFLNARLEVSSNAARRLLLDEENDLAYMTTNDANVVVVNTTNNTFSLAFDVGNGPYGIVGERNVSMTLRHRVIGISVSRLG